MGCECAHSAAAVGGHKTSPPQPAWADRPWRWCRWKSPPRTPTRTWTASRGGGWVCCFCAGANLCVSGGGDARARARGQANTNKTQTCTCCRASWPSRRRSLVFFLFFLCVCVCRAALSCRRRRAAVQKLAPAFLLKKQQQKQPETCVGQHKRGALVGVEHRPAVARQRHAVVQQHGRPAVGAAVAPRRRGVVLGVAVLAVRDAVLLFGFFLGGGSVARRQARAHSLPLTHTKNTPPKKPLSKCSRRAS